LTCLVNISARGQITVPAPVRDKLGLAPGTAVQFVLREGGVLLRKGAAARNRSIRSSGG